MKITHGGITITLFNKWVFILFAKEVKPEDFDLVISKLKKKK